MDLQSDERRGEDARRILDDAIYREAWELIRNRIIEQLEHADIPEDRRGRLNDLLIAHKKARQYMEQVLVTGTLAATEIDRQASLTERMTKAWRAA